MKKIAIKQSKRISTSKFAVERSVIHADENFIVYDDTIPELQSLWNELSKYYLEQAEQSRKLQGNKELFKKEIEHAIAANYTAIAAHEHSASGNIKVIRVEEKEQPVISIKRYLIEQLIDILQRRRQELQRCVLEEREAAAELSSIAHPVIFAENTLRIYLNHKNFLEYRREKQIDEYQLSGLLCVIKYRGITLSGYSCASPKSYYDAAAEYFYERQACQEFVQGDLEVSITLERQDAFNPICMAVLAELRKGCPMKQLSEKIVVALSRHVMDMLLTAEPIRVLNASHERMIDGRSETFFVIQGGDIFKVSRSKTDFEIRRNGMAIRFCNK